MCFKMRIYHVVCLVLLHINLTLNVLSVKRFNKRENEKQKHSHERH
jgi:hypothetical protein